MSVPYRQVCDSQYCLLYHRCERPRGDSQSVSCAAAKEGSHACVTPKEGSPFMSFEPDLHGRLRAMGIDEETRSILRELRPKVAQSIDEAIGAA
jgi:hypothetical protein